MHASLQKLFDEIEVQRETTLRPLRDQPAERLSLSPGGGKWSAVEVLSHVMAAEQLSVLYMRKKIQGIDNAARSGPWESLKIAALILSQRLPGLKFRAPRRVVENTTQLTSLAQIESTWKENRQELREFLERIPENRVDRKIYKHPAAGYLDTRHALIFFREHLIHHTPQLKKLVK